MNPDRPRAASPSRLLQVARLGGVAIALGLFCAGMWFAWLGWDHEYYEVNGIAQGPYRSWQVIGCGVSVAVAAVLAYVWIRGDAAIVVLAAAADAGFAVPWTIDAASNDDSGLFVVGLVMIVVGGGVALVCLLALTHVVTAAVASRRLLR